ncbi:GNAT family N-acetyltransferase [Thermostichus vulcanus]|uniref:GNAT family N-acetyltransferase n=1 Tax=Thermostichus vulcanus str. 'Rupite' TaxID=2813851 RepID=A0ABT0CCT4_THEVL|nr:GNAT family N-acetyltransferase [Thermostichus vulcanus]MCJ2543522.1 GNAT family N-acetyltransferase [Thermostichus vulcanus str. 'Rupite']
MQIEIRPVENSDSAALLHILEVVFAEYPGCVLDLEEVPELLQPATAFAHLGGSLWVAQQEEQVVGCVGMVPTETPERMELKKLYTLPRVRGKGLGRRLIEQVEAEARHQQAKYVHLWTDTRFTTAHRVYERLGYARLPETRKLYDRSNSVEYHYEKRLR